jgi:hypothetical protein
LRRAFGHFFRQRGSLQKAESRTGMEFDIH